MAYDATNLYLGVGGVNSAGGAGTWNTASAGTAVTIYLGNGTGEGTTTGPASINPTAIPTLPVASTDVIVWFPSNPTVVTAQTWSGTAWQPASYTPTVGYESGAKVEFSIKLTDLGGSSGPPNITMVGAVLNNVGGAGGATIYETFPIPHEGGGQYSDFIDASRQSCLGPAQQLHTFCRRHPPELGSPS